MFNPNERFKELFGKYPEFIKIYSEGEGLSKTVVLHIKKNNTATWYYTGNHLLWFEGSSTPEQVEKMKEFFK